MSRQENCFFAVCSAFCLLSLTLSPCVGMPSTTDVPDPVNGSIHELPTQNTTESQCDREQINSNGTNVCLVRTWPPECLGYIFLAGIVGYAACFVGLPCLLAAVGFRLIGITGGSPAAIFQSHCGTPGCFRSAQSTAMLGTPLSKRGCFGFAGLILGVLAGIYWLPMCFTEQGSHVYAFDNYTLWA